MRHLFRALALVVAFHLIIPAANAAQNIDPEMSAAIDELLEVTGATQMVDQIADAVMAGMKQSMEGRTPKVPDRVLEIAREETLAVFRENQPELIDLMRGVYSRHFTAEEVRQLTAFYKTPVGRKSVSVIPAIAQESVLLGQSWAQKIMPQAMRRIEQRIGEAGLN